MQPTNSHFLIPQLYREPGYKSYHTTRNHANHSQYTTRKGKGQRKRLIITIQPIPINTYHGRFQLSPPHLPTLQNAPTT